MTQATELPKVTYTAEEVAIILQCSLQTVYKAVRSQELSCFTVGERHFRFRMTDIETYMKRKERQAQAPASPVAPRRRRARAS